MAKISKQEMMSLLLDGKSYKEIGLVAGVSRQRVEQLISPPKHIMDAIKLRATSRCENCGIEVKSGAHLHHNNGNDITIDDFNDTANIQYLCVSCHRIVHGGGSMGKTTAIGIRLDTDTLKEIQRRAFYRKISVNRWINNLLERTLWDKPKGDRK